MWAETDFEIPPRWDCDIHRVFQLWFTNNSNIIVHFCAKGCKWMVFSQWEGDKLWCQGQKDNLIKYEQSILQINCCKACYTTLSDHKYPPIGWFELPVYDDLWLATFLAGNQREAVWSSVKFCVTVTVDIISKWLDGPLSLLVMLTCVSRCNHWRKVLRNHIHIHCLE